MAVKKGRSGGGDPGSGGGLPGAGGSGLADRHEPNLAAFVDAGILPPECVRALTDAQRKTIENLDRAQVRTILDVHGRVGRVGQCFFI